MSFIKKTRSWYGRFERPISSLSLVAGFVFDALTLKRLDTLWENFWILSHLLIVGVFIILVHLKKNESEDEKDPGKAHFWFVNILQFFFGGLISTYLVFYFRSANIFVAWPFLALLALAFIANESLKRYYVRLNFQISLFFLSIYSFAIFLIPILTHKINVWIFLISGAVSLAAIFIFVLILFYFIRDKNHDSRRRVVFPILSIFILINLLYFTNIIPPIPLSLKDGGVYHSIQKTSDGNYGVTYEDAGWKEYFKMYQDFQATEGDFVYAYSAIFSPTGLNITVFHEWQYYDERQKKWQTEVTIDLSLIGGREGGFRTYSSRSNLSPGKWRVNIKTEDGLNIGRLRFNIVRVDVEPPLVTTVKK